MLSEKQTQDTMLVPTNFHPVHSIDNDNVATSYRLIITGSSEKVVFVGKVTTQRNTKRGLVAMLQDAGDDLFDIVGDGAVQYKSKAFVFSGANGTFFAKLEKA